MGFVVSITQTFYHIMCIFHLADERVPAMDMHKFYFIQAVRIIRENLPRIALTHADFACNDIAIMEDAIVYVIGTTPVEKVPISIQKEMTINHQTVVTWAIILLVHMIRNVN